MGYYELYKQRLSITGKGKNLVGARMNSTAQFIINSFKDSPQYRKIKVNDITYDAKVVSSKDETEKAKEVFFMPYADFSKDELVHNYHCPLGSIIEFDDNKWIVDDFQFNEIFPKAKLLKCNYDFRWKDEFGKVHTVPSVAINATMYSIGINTHKMISVPDGKLAITLPLYYYPEASLIERDLRVIFRNRFAYQVSFMDLATEGLLHLILGEDEIRVGLDDLINGIADDSYTLPVILFNDDILELIPSQTSQMPYKIWQSEEEIDAPVTFESSDKTIATVDSMGNITGVKIGSCNIKAFLNNNTLVFDTCRVDIVETVNIQLDINIIGSESIRKGMSENYECNVTSSGIIDNTKTFTWAITGNTIATITKLTNTKCTIQAKSIGSFVLVGTCVEDNSLVSERTINVTSIF